MDFFHVSVKSHLVKELIEILSFYDYKFKTEILDDSNEHNIVRHKKTCETKYDTLEEFLLKEIFYRKKRNLKYSPIKNSTNDVANCNITIVDIISGNPILNHLLRDDSPFLTYIEKVNNFGTFIRFAENKAQRLYWNPALNAGIPLSEKKSPTYEVIFLMHDFGHLPLPDLVFTGKVSKISKIIYVCWRLLGESFTLTLNEMFVPHYLKNCVEFQQGLSVNNEGNSVTYGYDKPYRLFEVLMDNVKTHDKKALFRAAFDYFCKQKSDGYMNMIDKSKGGWEVVWNDFDGRYLPVSMRGREWTEDNFDSLEKMKYQYTRWWEIVSKHSQIISDLNFTLLDNVENIILSVSGKDENEITDQDVMDILFELVWKDVISPILSEKSLSKTPIQTTIQTTIQTSTQRRIITQRAFRRYMIGNIFLLIMHNIDVTEILDGLEKDEINVNAVVKMYTEEVFLLYTNGKISLNEYHNYKNIFLMIPPNILRKEDY